MMTPEQIAASHKATVETLFGLTAKAFEGVEKMVELNLSVAKAALDESANNTQAALSVKDAQDLLAMQANMFQPLAEKTAAYSRHLYDIASARAASSPRPSKPKAPLRKSISPAWWTALLKTPQPAPNKPWP